MRSERRKFCAVWVSLGVAFAVGGFCTLKLRTFGCKRSSPHPLLLLLREESAVGFRLCQRQSVSNPNLLLGVANIKGGCVVADPLGSWGHAACLAELVGLPRVLAVHIHIVLHFKVHPLLNQRPAKVEVSMPPLQVD